MGQSGNHIHQVVNAVVMALAVNRTLIVTPGYENSAWEIPQVFSVDHTMFPSQMTRACVLEVDSDDGVYDCELLFKQRCRSTVGDRRQVFLKVISKFIKAEVRQACQQQDDQTLTVHIRDGGVVKQSNYYHLQPPCAFYHSVVRTGRDGQPFDKVQIIHSGERPANPCVKSLNDTFPQKVVQHRESMQHDVCALLMARNVAPAASSFSITLFMMNPNVQRLFVMNTQLDWEWHGIEEAEGTSIGRLYRKVNDYELSFKQLCSTFPSVDYFHISSGSSLVNMLGNPKKSHWSREYGKHWKKYFLDFEENGNYSHKTCKQGSVQRRA